MDENLRPSAPQYCARPAGCSFGDATHATTLVPDSQDLGNPAVGGDTWTRGETLNVRFGKGFRFGRGRVQASVDIYNLMNSSAMLAQNNTLGPSWRTPTSILQGRLFKVGGQIDF